MPRYEYTEMIYLHHRSREGLDALNELGAEGWKPAFQAGKTFILWREIEDAPEATIEDWREVYPTLSDEELQDLDAEGVILLMGRDFDLPTRATLNRWAQEARESVE